MKRDKAMEVFKARLNFSFKDVALLESVFVHSSFVNEKGGGESNERLEFFGDAVLSAVISGILYDTYPGFSRGRTHLHQVEARQQSRPFQSGERARHGRINTSRQG